ncbi:MAG: hypothetical protein ABI690_27130 [Chloroflexota bacterium]
MPLFMQPMEGFFPAAEKLKLKLEPTQRGEEDTGIMWGGFAGEQEREPSIAGTLAREYLL